MNIQELRINDFTIKLPVGLERPLNTPVRDSYQEFLKNNTNDVRRHLTAVCELLPPLLREVKPKNILHAFGGVGATAQVIDQVADWVHFHEFWERDPVLVNYLIENFRNSAVRPVSNSFDRFNNMSSENLDEYDLLLMDMSVGTIKTAGVKDMWARIADWMDEDRFVWFTDTACHKIHLNYKTYTQDFDCFVHPTAEGYLVSYDKWLKKQHGLTITAAMREAGEYYCVVRSDRHKPFSSIPYL